MMRPPPIRMAASFRSIGHLDTQQAGVDQAGAAPEAGESRPASGAQGPLPETNGRRFAQSTYSRPDSFTRLLRVQIARRTSVVMLSRTKLTWPSANAMCAPPPWKLNPSLFGPQSWTVHD